ncbi:hypothetical protein IV203_008413 [Nitzschia inconspicua]|uniref:Uncharacterized protein n=1 Tax=Nitzschia inconspicua TaxID=303405 RepID=A0A9K3L062_9STRA|nr:hypothetical protein IV203_008413 [Nitzschia inconspicua]
MEFEDDLPRKAENNGGGVGCGSHRFNLAVTDILKDYAALITCVYRLMKKLKNIIPAAKLRKLTPLRAKCSNATRWSSTYEMLVRYKQLEEFLPKLGLVEVEDMMPNHSQKFTIDLLMSILTDLQSVTKALQAENRTVLEVRDLFDEVIKTCPQTKNRLGENASIIHDNVFESAVQKIFKGSEEELTPDESVKVTGLRHGSSTNGGRNEDIRRTRRGCWTLASRKSSKATTSCVHNDFKICIHGFTFHCAHIEHV